MTFDLPAAPERIVKLPNLGFWTENRIAYLRENWGQADQSAATIAIALGTTRNAVIGKVGRIGLRLSQSKLSELRGNRNRTYTTKGRIYKTGERKMWEIKETEATDLPPDQPDNPTTFVELRDDQCRWPCSGEGIETVFCGGDAIKGHAYCGRHCRMAYTPQRRITRTEFHIEAQKRRANHKAEAA